MPGGVLDHWENFYLITGGAAGALTGLMFVVVSLTANQDLEKALRGASVYMNPIIFQYSVVLVASALATAPLSPVQFALAAGVSAVAGFAAAARVAFQLRWGRMFNAPHWTDFWWYGVSPAAAYLGLGAAAAATFKAEPCAPALVALAIVALLLIAIRNAWDLIIWVTPRAKPPREP